MNREDTRPNHLRLVWSERLKRSTPAWQEKLQRIREQLWKGTYAVNAEDVAKALLRKEKFVFGTKQSNPSNRSGWWRKTRRPPLQWAEETGDG